MERRASMDVQRVTLDMPVELNEAVNAAVKRTSLSKAQYMRMALEVMNMISGQKDATLVIKKGEKESQILIPGVLAQ
jgi:predicted DNA-binding protein